ncbi:hypothetical protein [Leptothoe spongobia]|nr:hypothetical protein [Leptothoe spongobia]
MFVYDPYGIAREIAKRAALIEQLNWEIEELRQSQIFDVEDNTDYTD